MKTRLFLRIASVVVLVQAVLHTIGGVFGKPIPGAGEVAVAAMKANQFQLDGVNRTYWDFFIGFGLGITVFLTIEGIVFWMLGGLAAKGVEVRPILAAFFVGYVSLAVVAYEFFFSGPLTCDAVVAALLAIAIYAARPVAVRAAVGAEA